MDKNILVGLDGSPLAEAALPFAEVFARAKNARVVLVRVMHVDELPVPPPDDPASDPVSEIEPAGVWPSPDLTAEQRAESDAEHYLDAIVQRMGSRGVVAEAVVAAGDPATVLVEEAQLRAAEMIILSTHGRSGVGRWIYGSVADAVMRDANVPVLLVPPGCHRDWPRDHPPRILVPLDGSTRAGEALPVAQSLAMVLGAEVFPVQVIEPITYTYAMSPEVAPYVFRDLESEEEVARTYLTNVAAELRCQGLPAHERVLQGPVTPTLTKFAHDTGIDLIVIASHGSGGMTRLLLGSVATGVVQRATAPILVVRPEVSPEALAGSAVNPAVVKAL